MKSVAGRRLLSSKLIWDTVGHLYNRRILILLKDVYREIAEDVSPPEKARILDVGCGPGFFTIMLARLCTDATLTGVDFSLTEVRAARRSAAAAGVTNCRFIQADAMDLPFEDRSFEQVISTFSMKHWPDRDIGMEEIFRVLVPGGQVLLTEYNRDYSEEEYCRFYERAESVLGRFLSAFPTTPPAVRWVTDHGLSLHEVILSAEKAGFTEIRGGRIEGWPYLEVILEK